MIPARVIERTLTKAHREGECLVSDYSVGSHGYAQVGWRQDGKATMMLCHRVAWTAHHGAIPDGLTVDHLCRNRRCIEITHLRLLSNVDNARLNGNAVKTHCPAGHEYDSVNTRRDRRGHRFCRACARRLARERSTA